MSSSTLAKITRIAGAVVVFDPFGLHARPAAQFVKTARAFEADITVRLGGVSADGKSLLGLLSLNAGPSAVLEVLAEGADAAPALRALEHAFSRPGLAGVG